MTWKRLRTKLRLYAQYFPFTINTVLCAGIVWVGYKLLYRTPDLKNPENAFASFLPLILLMIKLAFWFFISLVALSVFTTFGSWFYFLFLRKRDPQLFKISFTHEEKKHRLYLHALIERARRPLLGYVKGRLVYEDNLLTDYFTLQRNKKRKGKEGIRGLSGSSQLLLPDVREYTIRGSFLYFEDMLRLVSLTSRQKIQAHFNMPPVLTNEAYDAAHPRRTETNEVRTEELHKTEGDYLNYKDFETGDDVRRIVWKVYARNRELVVRVPEIFEPYVSHVYCYASFYAASRKALSGNPYATEMLNFYKNKVWTIYLSLSQKDYEVRFIPDQEIKTVEELKGSKRTAHLITASEWHHQKMLSQYFNPRQGAVLCISSFTDVADLKETLSQCGSGTVVYFIKCSTVFRHFAAWHWFKRLILLPPKDRLGNLRSTWTFSSFRVMVQKKEKEIEALLKKSDVRQGAL